LLYVPLAADASFRTHHTVTNALPLYPWHGWLVVLLPFAVAGIWRYRRGIALRKEEEWLVAWLIAAAACLFLPVPWKRKLTEALIVPCVFLTMPAWMAMRDWAGRTTIRWQRWAQTGGLCFVAAAGPLLLTVAMAQWSADPSSRGNFHARREVMDAWRHLASHAPKEAVVGADDLLAMSWTKAYAVRMIWLGHAHATPDPERKWDAWRELMSTTSSQRADELLREGKVTHFLTTSASSTAHFAGLLGPTGWQETYRSGEAAIFAKGLK
jgi:hypothetical protein